MNKQNNLPKYWVVKNTNNDDFKVVINYLNNIVGSEFWTGNTYKYYGYDGTRCQKGTDGNNQINHFTNKPTLLTLEEFKKAINMKEEFVLPEKWAISRNLNSLENVEVTNWFNKKFNYNYSASQFKNSYYIYPKVQTNNYHNLDHIPASYTEITFEQFKKYVLKMNNNKQEFPKDDFGVIVESNAKEIVNFLVSKGFDKNYMKGNSNDDNIYYVSKDSIKINATLNTNIVKKVYTLKELKEMDDNKKIIGYKLIKDTIENRVGAIYKKESNYVCRNAQYHSLEPVFVENNPEWFTPIYEEEVKTINMGSFNLTVKDKKVFHKNEDITNFVKYLVENYDRSYRIQSFTVEIDEITFKTTGCQHNSKLSDWLKVYDMIK